MVGLNLLHYLFYAMVARVYIFTNEVLNKFDMCWNNIGLCLDCTNGSL